MVSNAADKAVFLLTVLIDLKLEKLEKKVGRAPIQRYTKTFKKAYK